MQYDLDKLVKDSTIALTWHGEPTLVLVKGEGEKREVKTGDSIEVSVEQAKTLLKSSFKWTLKGDKPEAQPFEKAQKAANERQEALMRRVAKKNSKKAEDASGEATEGEGDEGEGDDMMPLTEADVDAMDTKAEVLRALKARDVKANKNATLDELKGLLKEKLAEPAPEAGAEGEGDEGEGSDDETKE